MGHEWDVNGTLMGRCYLEKLRINLGVRSLIRIFAPQTSITTLLHLLFMDEQKKIQVNHYDDGTASVLRRAVVFSDLRFYQRSDVLVQLTKEFCGRYLPKYGDRTVDQMVQAARSIKQNIAEGSSDGQTSMEVELKLLGIARGSNQELLEDYKDYLKRQGKREWYESQHSRFVKLQAYCREHCRYEDYQQMLPKMNDEELSNMAICLCHQVDKAMTSYIERKDREFTTEGGIRERMTAARLDQRETQKQVIARQGAEIAQLRAQLAQLQAQNAQLQAQNAQLQAQNAQLRAQNAQLQAQLAPKE